MILWAKRIRKAWWDWQDAVSKPRARLPLILQFPINDICNSKCQMCHIWQKKRDHEITPDELDRILTDPFYREVAGVGINGGEPTLRNDLEALLEVMVRRLPRLSSISLITNAIRPGRVIAAIDALGQRCRVADVRFDVMVSLDGVGEVHDRVRGVPGNFEGALEVIGHIQGSPWVDSARIGCTIIAENVYEVEDVLEFARSRDIYARFRMGVPHQRLYTADLSEPFSLDEEARFHLASFLDGLAGNYEAEPARRAFYRSLRNQLVYGYPRVAGCAWKNRGVTLSSRGELSYCAVASPNLGDARLRASTLLIQQNPEVLASILENRCADCRHDYDGIGSRKVLLRQWAYRLEPRIPPWSCSLVRKGAAWTRTASEWHQVLGRVPVRTALRPKRSRKILLCGWYGTETLGDRAILAGITRIIQTEIPDAVIDVVSLEPYVTRHTARCMPELALRAVVSMDSALKAVAAGEYAAVAIAGGPLMTPVREVIDLQLLLRAGIAGGVRIGVLGCGLGPLAASGPRLHAIRWIMRSAHVCVLRDEASVRLARERLGRALPVECACDPAHFWSALSSEGPPIMDGPPIVALALRELMVHEYLGDLKHEAALATKERLERELVALVNRLAAEKGRLRVATVCMHTHTVGGDDRVFTRRLLSGFPDVLDSTPWRRRAPHEELAIIRTAGAVCAMRFHAAVCSMAMGVPVIALDYTRGGKMHALFCERGRSENLVSIDAFRGVEVAERLIAQTRVVGTQRVRLDLSADEATYRGAVRTLLRD